jgi:hypothetical protein
MGSSRKWKSTRAKRARPEDRSVPPARSRRAARQPSAPPARVRPGDKSAKNAGRGAAAPAAERQPSVLVRGRLRHYVLAELTALERARSVVQCLALAMQDGTSGSQGPYYPDVAYSASQLMTRTIGRLSDLLLEGRFPGTAQSDELP